MLQQAGQLGAARAPGAGGELPGGAQLLFAEGSEIARHPPCNSWALLIACLLGGRGRLRGGLPAGARRRRVLALQVLREVQLVQCCALAPSPA